MYRLCLPSAAAGATALQPAVSPVVHPAVQPALQLAVQLAGQPAEATVFLSYLFSVNAVDSNG